MVEKVLLIENHPDVARVFSFMLSERGFTVSIAPSLEQARQCLSKNSFDLILCDYRVDDGTAIDFMDWLKTQPSRPPTICVSGFGDEAAVLCERAGFHGFLRKPVDLNLLERHLRGLGLTFPTREGNEVPQGVMRPC